MRGGKPRPSALDEVLATPSDERDQFLAQQLREAPRGSAVRVHVMACPLARGGKRCMCRPLVLVAGASA